MTGMFEDIDVTRFRGQPVAIATGGTSSEREISLKTGGAFEQALVGLGYDVSVFDVADQLQELAEARPAAVLLGIHGGLGESGALQGYLESLRIPYSGSGVLASALAMDKQRARLLADAAGVPVARGQWISLADLADPDALVAPICDAFGAPVVVKLNDSGSSFGVFICRDEAEISEALNELAEFVGGAPSAGVLVEEFVEGPEFTVGFFDHRCLGVMEIRPEQEFYDFEAKYQSDSTEYLKVTDSAVTDPLIEWGERAFRGLGCRGVARVDFKGHPQKSKQVVMLEVNTIPGMTTTSLVPKMAANLGVEFDAFVELMLAAARVDEQK